ncbi:MAG: hypothetical protein IKO63_08190 [Paludibacteraceae bacterium]|nr:hypothetical protein [Paludibacteraceae bacterium]
MSVLFPKVNKPREWDYRPIYYDEEKEARKQKLARLQALREQKEQADSENKDGKEHVTTLHRGSFREAHEAQTKLRIDTERKSKLSFWIVLLILLFIVFYWLL